MINPIKPTPTMNFLASVVERAKRDILNETGLDGVQELVVDSNLALQANILPGESATISGVVVRSRRHPAEDNGTRVSHEYATVMSPGERILSPHPAWEVKTRTLVPTAFEMRAEMVCAIRAAAPGVEVIDIGRAPRRALYLEDGLLVQRDKAYARIDLATEDIEAGDVDAVRGGVFHACRLLGAVAARTARDRGMATLRFQGVMPRWIRGLDDESIGVLLDDMRDGVVLRVAIYYFAAPHGREMEPAQ